MVEIARGSNWISIGIPVFYFSFLFSLVKITIVCCPPCVCLLIIDHKNNVVFFPLWICCHCCLKRLLLTKPQWQFHGGAVQTSLSAEQGISKDLCARTWSGLCLYGHHHNDPSVYTTLVFISSNVEPDLIVSHTTHDSWLQCVKFVTPFIIYHLHTFKDMATLWAELSSLLENVLQGMKSNLMLLVEFEHFKVPEIKICWGSQNFLDSQGPNYVITWERSRRHDKLIWLNGMCLQYRFLYCWLVI